MGDHWSVVRSIAASRVSSEINIWIASAGYGLISPRSRVVSYAATLSKGHADSVASSSAERRLWWDALTTSPIQLPTKGPRSIEQVAAKYATSPLIVAASPEYIDAMTHDIIAASERLATQDLLSVLCRRGAAPAELQSFIIPVKADLASELGGALTSLNARVIRWLVSFGTAKLTRSTVRRYVGQLAKRCVPRDTPKRIKLTDAEVRLLIKAEQEEFHRSRSALLRVIRQKGYAVEQARFAQIYREIAEVNNAS